MAKVMKLFRVTLDTPKSTHYCSVVAPTMRKAILLALSECDLDNVEPTNCELIFDVLCDCKA